MATNHDIADRLCAWMSLHGDIFADEHIASTEGVMPNSLNMPVLYNQLKQSAVLNYMRGIKNKSMGTYQIREQERHQVYTESGGLFYPVTETFSYNKRIAVSVINLVSRTIELWVSPNFYSATTDKHTTLLMRSFETHTRSHYTLNRAVHRTRAVHTYVNRIDHMATTGADGKIGFAIASMKSATQPRVHETTRWKEIMRARQTLLHVLTEISPLSNTVNATGDNDKLLNPVGLAGDDIYSLLEPVGGAGMLAARHKRAEVRDEAMAMLSFLQHVTSLSLRDMRAAVTGYLALNDIKGNT